MILFILLLALAIAFCIGIIYSWYALNQADKPEPEPDLSLPRSRAYFADKERLERFNAALGNEPRRLYRFEPLEMELEDTFTPDELPQRPTSQQWKYRLIALDYIEDNLSFDEAMRKAHAEYERIKANYDHCGYELMAEWQGVQYWQWQDNERVMLIEVERVG